MCTRYLGGVKYIIIFFSRLSKNFLPKKKEDDEYQFTATKAFKLMLNEINDLAGWHLAFPRIVHSTSFFVVRLLFLSQGPLFTV
jgi:hypothetical protein